MADRRVLVIDNQTNLFNAVKSTLATYGCDTQRFETGEDSIHKIKTLQPNIVIIGLQGPEKTGLSLCSKAKKVAGSRIPVVLVTKHLSKSDIELHGKQRYHADLYIEESELSDKAIYEKIGSLINLSLNESSTAPSVDATDPKFHLSYDRTPKEPIKIYTDVTDNETIDRNTNEDEPSWIKNLFDEVLVDSSETNSFDTDQHKRSIDKLLSDDWDSYNDLEHRLIEQEKEIALLTAQLEEARREARSSPFSSDYMSLREGSAQKEKEIIILREKLDARQQQILSSEQRLKELAKRLLSTKTELDQLQFKVKDRSEQYTTAQTELSKLNRAFEESRIHYDLQIEKLTTEHAEKLKQSEKDFLIEIDSLKKQLASLTEQADSAAKQELQNTISQIRQEYEDRITILQKDHSVEVKNLKKEKDSIVNSMRSELSHETSTLQQKHEQKIDSIEKNHADELKQLTDQIDELNNEHKKVINNIKQDRDNQIQSLERQYEEKIENFEKDINVRITNLKDEHISEIENIQSAMDGAQQCVDTEIEALLADHEAVIKQMEKDHLKETEKLKQLLKDEKDNAEARIQNEVASEISKLIKNHDIELKKLKKTIDENKKEHEDKIESIKVDHQVVLSKNNKEFNDRIASLNEQLEEAKENVEYKFKEESQQELENIRIEQKELIAKLKKEHAEEIYEIKAANEILKQKLSSIKGHHEVELNEMQKGRHNKQTEKISEIKAECDNLKQKIKSAEEQSKTKIEKLKATHQKELKSFDKKYKQSLHDLDMQYAARIAELKAEHESEIQTLKNSMDENAKRADDRLAQEQKDHEETRIKLESRLAEHLVAQSKRTTS